MPTVCPENHPLGLVPVDADDAGVRRDGHGRVSGQTVVQGQQQFRAIRHQMSPPVRAKAQRKGGGREYRIAPRPWPKVRSGGGGAAQDAQGFEMQSAG